MRLSPMGNFGAELLGQTLGTAAANQLFQPRTPVRADDLRALDTCIFLLKNHCFDLPGVLDEGAIGRTTFDTTGSGFNTLLAVYTGFDVQSLMLEAANDDIGSSGGTFSSLVPGDFNGFVYMLEGEASFGADLRTASRSQIAVLGHGDRLIVNAAVPGTRFLLMAGKPYGEAPIYNGPYVD